MDVQVCLAVAAISLLANYLKGVIGTGTGTVMVALASFIIDPKLAVVIVCYVGVFSGLAMVRLEKAVLPDAYWIPIAVVIAIGSGLGAMTLKYVPAETYKTILGVAFLLAAVWFAVRHRKTAVFPPQPPQAGARDLAVSGVSGFLGGFLGMNASPMIMHFGRILDKRRLRRLFVLIFLGTSIVQTLTFMANGLLTREAVALSLVTLPTMALGLYLGNHSFLRMPEAVFSRILAGFLVVAALRMIWQGVT